MQVSNTDMSSLLMNMQNMQVQEAMKQVEVAVAAQVGVDASNIDLVAPEVAEAIVEELASIAYSADGSIVNVSGNSLEIMA